MAAAGCSGRQGRCRMRGWSRVLGLLVLLSAVLCGSAADAQLPTPDDSTWFESTRREWDRILEEVEAYFASDLQTPEETSDQRALLDVAQSLAVGVKQSAEERLSQAETLLAALGPPPQDNAPPEMDDIALKRQLFTNQIAMFRGQVAEADVALARINAIKDRQLSRVRKDLRERLTVRLPVPIDPDVLLRAAPEFAGIVVHMASTPARWYQEARDQVHVRLSLHIPIVMAAAAALVWVGLLIRRAILARYGPKATELEPRYATRFLAAVARFIAIGVVPAILLGVFHVFIHRDGALMTGEFRDLIDALTFAMVFYLIIHAVARAVLSPDQPAWQLTGLASDTAGRLVRRISFLAGVVAVDAFFETMVEDRSVSPFLQSSYLTAFSLLEVIAVVLLTRDHLWEPARQADADETRTEQPSGPSFWRLVRHAAALTSVIALIACLLGYVPFGRFLINGLFATAIVFGALLILRAFLYDGLSLAIQSKAVRRSLRLPDSSGDRVIPWARIALDPALFLLAIIALAPAWGAPIDVVQQWIVGLADGISIGNVTLSPVDIVIAVLAFFLTIALTRLLQRQLLDRVFPYTKMPIGLQHSVAGGLSYIGVIAAAAIAIAVLGIDLTNIAIVLGALSVGIGFGLQNIVNNFVSGLILLIERPVNVGDWVIVGGLEGIVKRINIRATEIETWQRASIVVPNAEVLSTAITNLTLRDRYGRLEVDVTVAFGVDTEKVERLLLEVARKAPEVASYPAPFVIFKAYGAYGLQFRLHCFIANIMDKLIVTSSLLHAVEARLRAEGVSIPYPQSVIHVAHGGIGLGAPSASADGPAVRLRDAEGEMPGPGAERSRSQGGPPVS